MEYRMACRILLAPNFFEGVRAAIVDRDRTPRWQPDRLDAVTADAIAAYFAPLPPDAELPDQPESPTPSTSSITAA
jgi:enoyl-CoA hydratase